MKKNLNHITMILILTLGYNIQNLAAARHVPVRSTKQLKEEEELTRKADAEIEDLLINSEIPTPVYNTPPLWEVLVRQYGIKLFYTCYSFKTWLVKTYYNIKETMCENSVNDDAA